MKRVMMFAAVLLTAGVMATSATGPTVVATDSAAVELGERDSDAARFRLALSGVGRFNQKVKSDFGGKESFELYGIGLDAQYNLYSRDAFNLWLGIGYTFTPEQEAVNYKSSYTDSYEGYQWSESDSIKLKLKGHDIRLMLIPEWALSETFALGVRLGISLAHYDGKVTERYTYSDADGALSASGSWSDSDTVVQGIIGVQATWLFSEFIGLQAYCDAYFGRDLDMEIEGEKIGSYETSGVTTGIAIVGQF